MEMRIYQLATGLLHLKPLYYQGKKQPPWSCTMMRPIHTSLMAADLVVGFRHPCPEVYNSRTPPQRLSVWAQATCGLATMMYSCHRTVSCALCRSVVLSTAANEHQISSGTVRLVGAGAVAVLPTHVCTSACDTCTREHHYQLTAVCPSPIPHTCIPATRTKVLQFGERTKAFRVRARFHRLGLQCPTCTLHVRWSSARMARAHS